nr:polysaccharide biosynthesis/export family protein [Oscillatoria laete-virens]
MGFNRILFCVSLIMGVFLAGHDLFSQDGNFNSPPPGFAAPSRPAAQPSQGSGSPGELINTEQPTEIISSNTQGGNESVVPKGIAVSDNYVIKGSDIISVTVINEPELSVRGNRVTSSGMILLPLLGEVKVLGFTLQQAREHITRLLKADYLVNPQVVVTLEATDQNEFIMRGQVAGVGVNKIPTDGNMTLLKAIYSRGPHQGRQFAACQDHSQRGGAIGNQRV